MAGNVVVLTCIRVIGETVSRLRDNVLIYVRVLCLTDLACLFSLPLAAVDILTGLPSFLLPSPPLPALLHNDNPQLQGTGTLGKASVRPTGCWRAGGRSWPPSSSPPSPSSDTSPLAASVGSPPRPPRAEGGREGRTEGGIGVRRASSAYAIIGVIVCLAAACLSPLPVHAQIDTIVFDTSELRLYGRVPLPSFSYPAKALAEVISEGGVCGSEVSRLLLPRHVPDIQHLYARHRLHHTR